MCLTGTSPVLIDLWYSGGCEEDVSHEGELCCCVGPSAVTGRFRVSSEEADFVYCVTEVHLLFYCPVYEDLRDVLFIQISSVQADFFWLDFFMLSQIFSGAEKEYFLQNNL